MDAITQQIVQQLDTLPLGKKKAFLELLRQEHSPATSQFNTEQERMWNSNEFRQSPGWE